MRIVLGPGFHAKAGSNFRAGIDPLAGADQVTGTGGIAWNQQKAAKRSVKLGPDSALETGKVSGHVTARADFHPASASSGRTVIMAFEDSGDHVRVVYENGSVKLESSIDGTAASSVFVPGYSRSWPWARVEMELLPSGTVTAWLYGHETTRFKGASRSVTVPANWTPAFKAEGERGNGYLAGLYVGKAEAVTTYYDGLARQIQTRARAGTNDVVTQATYNRAGMPEKLLGPVHQSSSYAYSALAETAADSRVTTTTYDDDPLLRVSSVIPPGHDNNSAVDTRYGRWGTVSAPGRSYQTVDDEKGVLTTSVYDAYGRLQYAIADSAGTSSATRNNRTSFAYDALDRLTSTTMPGGGTSRYAYDTLGRMTSRYHPDADGATQYKYDDLGRMRFSQDARQRALTPGKVTFTVYDDFGRVTRVGEANATFSSLDPERSYAFERDSASWRSRMTYDDGGDAVADSDPVAGNGAASGGPNHAQGRLVKVEENTDADVAAEVVHRYAYDHLGNVRVKQVVIEGLAGAKTATYHHDLAGRVTRLVYPEGTQARYAYDGAGRLSRVWNAEGSTLAAFTHTAAGNVAAHVVGDDVVTGAYTYNPREWVTGIDYAGAFSDTLTYDRAGNVTRQKYQHGTTAAKTADYAYDDLYRITDFDLTGGVSEDFTYDRNGNIKTVASGGSTLTYKYSSDSTPNRPDRTTGTGGQTYAYNQNGSAISVAGNALSYDYRGLVTGYGNSHTYTRDSEGFRVKKADSAGTEYHLRGAGGAVLAEYNNSGTLTARYVYAGGDRLARVVNGSIHYYLKDHLGSTRTLMASDGSRTATYDYRPFGNILVSSGAEDNRFKFTGHERDTESGFDFMQYRTYEPDQMRFLQMDPRADKYPGLSPYAYAGNNPLKFIDARGDTLDVGGIGGGKKALSYLHSMVDEGTAKRITMGDGGRVSFDTEGLDLSQDSGLELLDNMINGSGMFLFEVSKTAIGRHRSTKELIPSLLTPRNLGIRVFSSTPRYAADVNRPKGRLPKAGYGGQVVLGPGRWTLGKESGYQEVPIGDITFHELSEVYHRTVGKLYYPDAHSRALEDGKRYRKQVTPPALLKVIYHSAP